MIPNFNDFLLYASEHTPEMQYDISTKFSNAWNEKIKLTQEDISLITQISLHSSYAALRQYHNWLCSQQSDSHP